MYDPLIPALPYDATPIPWVGDGPALGIGNGASSGYFGEREMIPGPPTIQWPRAYKTPVPPKWIETAGPVFYPGTTAYSDTTQKAVRWTYPGVPVLTFAPYADTQAPGAANDPDLIELGAPYIPT